MKVKVLTIWVSNGEVFFTHTQKKKNEKKNHKAFENSLVRLKDHSLW